MAYNASVRAAILAVSSEQTLFWADYNFPVYLHKVGVHLLSVLPPKIDLARCLCALASNGTARYK